MSKIVFISDFLFLFELDSKLDDCAPQCSPRSVSYHGMILLTIAVDLKTNVNIPGKFPEKSLYHYL